MAPPPRALIALLALVATSPIAAADAEWTPIFDGKSLDGWTPKIAGLPPGEDPLNTFSVKDGAIVVSYANYDRWNDSFGHLFHRVGRSDFRIRLEYRFTGDQMDGGPEWAKENSGLMLLCQPPATMGRDQHFPASVELQFLGAGNSTGTTGGLCTPGTILKINGRAVSDHCIASSIPALPPGEWVKAEAEVRGGRLVKVWINGRETLTGEDVELDPEDADARRLLESGENAGAMFSEGWISLQSESHPCEFRRIEVQAL